jgi:GTP cyclohydrolase I
MKIEKLIEAIEEIAPPHLQDAWDNSGVQLLPVPSSEVKKILVCLEITEAVLDEAIAAEADFIVTHHPLIFEGVKSIDYQSSKGRCIVQLIRNGIAVYSAHTSFDSVLGGNNDYLARLLGITDLSPIEAIDKEGNGSGRFGNFPEELKFGRAVDIVRQVLGNSDVLKTVGPYDSIIRKVGICTGSGAEFLDRAKTMGCDMFITGDLKYHEAQNAKEIGICVIDGGHFGTENIFTENFADQLYSKIGDKAEIIKSKVDINPFEW